MSFDVHYDALLQARAGEGLTERREDIDATHARVVLDVTAAGLAALATDDTHGARGYETTAHDLLHQEALPDPEGTPGFMSTACTSWRGTGSDLGLSILAETSSLTPLGRPL